MSYLNRKSSKPWVFKEEIKQLKHTSVQNTLFDIILLTFQIISAILFKYFNNLFSDEMSMEFPLK